MHEKEKSEIQALKAYLLHELPQIPLTPTASSSPTSQKTPRKIVVTSNSLAIKAAIAGLDKEYNRLEREEKLLEKFLEKLTKSTDVKDGKVGDVGDAEDEDSGRVKMTKEDLMTEGGPTRGNSDNSGDAMLDDDAAIVENANIVDIADASGADCTSGTSGASRALDQIASQKWASSTISTIASSGLEVKTPLGALALGLHVGLVGLMDRGGSVASVVKDMNGNSNSRGCVGESMFKCTETPTDVTSEWKSSGQGSEGEGGGAAGFAGLAPPIRELPRAVLVPTDWEKECTSNMSAGGLVAFRYRNLSSTAYLTVQGQPSTLSTTTDTKDPNVQVSIMLTTKPTKPGPSSQNAQNNPFQFPLSQYINLDEFHSELSKTNNVSPSLFYKSLSDLLLQCVMHFDSFDLLSSMRDSFGDGTNRVENEMDSTPDIIMDSAGGKKDCAESNDHVLGHGVGNLESDKIEIHRRHSQSNFLGVNVNQPASATPKDIGHKSNGEKRKANPPSSPPMKRLCSSDKEVNAEGRVAKSSTVSQPTSKGVSMEKERKGSCHKRGDNGEGNMVGTENEGDANAGTGPVNIPLNTYEQAGVSSKNNVSELQENPSEARSGGVSPKKMPCCSYQESGLKSDAAGRSGRDFLSTTSDSKITGLNDENDVHSFGQSFASDHGTSGDDILLDSSLCLLSNNSDRDLGEDLLSVGSPNNGGENSEFIFGTGTLSGQGSFVTPGEYCIMKVGEDRRGAKREKTMLVSAVLKGCFSSDANQFIEDFRVKYGRMYKSFKKHCYCKTIKEDVTKESFKDWLNCVQIPGKSGEVLVVCSKDTKDKMKIKLNEPPDEWKRFMDNKYSLSEENQLQTYAAFNPIPRGPSYVRILRNETACIELDGGKKEMLIHTFLIRYIEEGCNVAFLINIENQKESLEFTRCGCQECLRKLKKEKVEEEKNVVVKRYRKGSRQNGKKVRKYREPELKK